MSSAVHELSGLQKAGVLMISLGAEASARVFDHLTPEERDLLGAEIVKLRHVDDLTRRRVLDEVNDAVRMQILGGALAREKTTAPAPEPEDTTPLKWLEALDPHEVASMIARERPQNIALMLAHIAPQSAANILSALSEGTRNQVAHRLATMKPVAKEAIEAVDQALRQRAGKSVGSRGRDGVASFLGGATERVMDSVKGALGRSEPSPSVLTRRVFATPDDLLQLSDAEMRIAMMEVDLGDLCLALRVAGDDLRQAVLRNVSEEAGLTLSREIASPSQIRVREIERAQTRIVDALNRSFAAAEPVEALVG